MGQKIFLEAVVKPQTAKHGIAPCSSISPLVSRANSLLRMPVEYSTSNAARSVPEML
jgi:hypothetical protein